MTQPFSRGDMVWSYFPFAETPDRPAAIPHISIVMGVFTPIDASRATGHTIGAYSVAVGIYTSSRISKFGAQLPIGVIQVPAARARQNANAKPFYTDTRIRAYLPVHRSFFPDIDEPRHGVISSIDAGLFRQIVSEFARVNNRAPELIVNVGPLRPR